jgi:hypothetical protein
MSYTGIKTFLGRRSRQKERRKNEMGKMEAAAMAGLPDVLDAS